MLNTVNKKIISYFFLMVLSISVFGLFTPAKSYAFIDIGSSGDLSWIWNPETINLAGGSAGVAAALNVSVWTLGAAAALMAGFMVGNKIVDYTNVDEYLGLGYSYLINMPQAERADFNNRVINAGIGNYVTLSPSDILTLQQINKMKYDLSSLQPKMNNVNTYKTLNQGLYVDGVDFLFEQNVFDSNNNYISTNNLYYHRLEKYAGITGAQIGNLNAITDFMLKIKEGVLSDYLNLQTVDAYNYSGVQDNMGIFDRNTGEFFGIDKLGIINQLNHKEPVEIYQSGSVKLYGDLVHILGPTNLYIYNQGDGYVGFNDGGIFISNLNDLKLNHKWLPPFIVDNTAEPISWPLDHPYGPVPPTQVKVVTPSGLIGQNFAETGNWNDNFNDDLIFPPNPTSWVTLDGPVTSAGPVVVPQDIDNPLTIPSDVSDVIDSVIDGTANIPLVGALVAGVAELLKALIGFLYYWLVPRISLTAAFDTVKNAASSKMGFISNLPGVFVGTPQTSMPIWSFPVRPPSYNKNLVIDFNSYVNIFDWAKNIIAILIWLGVFAFILRILGWPIGSSSRVSDD